MPVDPQIERFLAGRHVAALATDERGGGSHVTAMWYLFEDGAFYIPTSSRSRKTRNVRERPHAGVMVDSRGPGPLRGAATRGPAQVLEGEDARRWNERVWRRYLTPAGLEEPGVGGLLRAHDDVTIRVEATRFAWWDMELVFGGLLERPDLVLPLDG